MLSGSGLPVASDRKDRRAGGPRDLLSRTHLASEITVRYATGEVAVVPPDHFGQKGGVRGWRGQEPDLGRFEVLSVGRRRSTGTGDSRRARPDQQSLQSS